MSAPPEKRRELGGSSSNSNLKKSAISKTPNYRVLIIGDQCGKSSILDVLMGGKFGPRHSTTVEEKIDFNFTCEDKSIVRLSFIDTSGALDSYSEILDKWFSEADLCLVVYSIASKPSFFGSQILLHRLRSRTPVLPTIVIGNQLDRKAERSVSVEQGKEISKDLTFLECSAKTGENIPALGNIIVALAKKYVGSGIRHNCVLKFFASPTWCKICNKFIWGVLEKQGYECSECKLTTHKKCSKLLFHNCTGEPRSPKMTPQKSVQTLRMSEFVREVVNDNLHDTLQDPKTLEAFRIFLKNSSISGLLHLELWLKLVEYHDLPKARRRDYAMVVYKTFFTKHDDYDPKLFMIKQEDIDTKVKEEKWDELMGGLEQLMFKRLESEFFPRFVKKELRKTFSGVEGFSLEDSFKDLRLAAHNFSKEDASSETNTDTISDTSSETSEEYASGTFVISEAVDQPPDSLPSINAQPEDWEINILALEKGEYIEGMSPDAFKKYAKQRPRLPSMFIKPGRYDK